MLRKLFGDRLRFLRQVKRITQEQLAASIGVTKQHLGLIERGISSPSFKALERLCDVLEVPPASLFLFGAVDTASEEASTHTPQPEATSARLVSGSGFWTIDIQTGEERWSNALHRLLGYSRQQPPSKGLFLSHVHDLDREAFEVFYEKALSGVTPRPLSCRIVRNASSFRHVRIHVDNQSDKDGAPLTISMSFIDTTELHELSQTMLLNQEQLEQAIHEKTRSLTSLIEQNEQEIQRRSEAERQARVFQDMVEASIDPMSFVSDDYIYLAANNQAARIWGTTPEAMQGSKVSEIIGAELFEQVIKPRLDLALAGEDIRSQGWFIHADGSQRFLDVTYTPRWENGSVVGVVACARDMTALQQAEEAFRQSEELLRTVTNNIPGTVYQFRMQPDGATDFPYMSEGVRDMFGISPEEATSDARAVMDRVHEEDQETVQRTIQASAESMTPYSLVHRLRRPDGVIKWIKAVSSPRKQADGSILWNGVALDITEQKSAEVRLEQRNMALENAERLASLGSWEWNMADNVLQVSRNWLAIHGSSNPNPTMKELMPMAHPDDIPAIEQAFARAADSGEPYSLEHRIVRQDTGEVRWVRAYGELKQSWDDQPRIMFGAALDITESKQREEQLLVATYALESSLSGVAFADLKGNITYANPLFKEMHGYSPEEELTGLRPGDLLENRDDEHMILKSLEDQGLFKDDIRICRKDGQPRIHKLEAHLVTTPSGEPLCLMGAFEDVTEQRLMMQQLRESQQRFDSLSSNLDGIVFRGDLQFRPIYMKGAVEEITGYAEQDFLHNGVTWDQLVHPEDLPQLLNETGSDALINSSGHSTRREYRILRQDGEERWVSETIHNVPDATDAPAFLEGVILDITREKRASEALGKSEAIYRAIFEKSSEGLLLHDVQGAILDANQSAQKMFGYSLEELKQLHASNLVHPEECEIVQQEFETVLRQEFVDSEHRYLRKDGSEIHVVATGKLVGKELILGVVRDVTEQKEAQAQLLQSEARLNEAQRIAAMGSFERDVKTGKATWSEQTFHIFGYQPYSVEPSNDLFRSHIHPEDAESVSQTLAGMTPEHPSVEFAFRFVRVDEATGWANVRCNLAFDAQGLPERVFGTIQDITALKKNELGLKWELKVNAAIVSLKEIILSSEFNMQKVSDQVLENVLELTQSEHGFVASVDSQSHAITGHTLTNTLGSPCRVGDDEFVNVFHPSESGRFNALFGHSVNTGEAFFSPDPARHPAAKGELPTGHVPITSFMSAPGIIEGKVRGLVAVANGASPYTEEDCKAVSRIASIFALALTKHHAYETLSRRDAMLQGFLNAVKESAFLVNLDGEVLYANETVAERLSTTTEQLIGTRIVDYLPKELAESRMARAMEVIRTGQPDAFEDERFGRQVQNLLYPIFEDGAVKHLAIMGIDVTERRKNEQELNKLMRAVENSPMSVVITNTQGVIEYVNPAFCSITGYCRDEALGKNPRVLKSGTHDDAFYKELWEAISSGRTWRGEMCNRKKNGELFWEQVAISPVKDHNGIITHYVAIKEDITAKREAEEGLRRSLYEFETIFSNSSVGIAVIDQERKYQRVNERFCTMFGYSESELLGESTRKLHLSEEHFLELGRIIKEQSAHSDRIAVEYPLRHKSGRPVMCLASARRFSTEFPEAGFIWVHEDITDKIELERLREDVERIMRHDLKAPLNGMLGVPQLLLMDDNLTDDQREMVNAIQESGRRMLRMIDQSLDIFKMETGAYEYTPTNVNVVTIINYVFKSCHSASEAKGLTMSLTVEGKPARSPFVVKAEEQLLYSMLSNLVTNAVEASPDGKTVAVDLSAAPHTTIKITNSGVIPTEIRKDFFKKYKTHGKKHGTGLGTYSAKLMADTMKYSLLLDINDEEDRTTITVLAPEY